MCVELIKCPKVGPRSPYRSCQRWVKCRDVSTCCTLYDFMWPIKILSLTKSPNFISPLNQNQKFSAGLGDSSDVRRKTQANTHPALTAVRVIKCKNNFFLASVPLPHSDRKRTNTPRSEVRPSEEHVNAASVWGHSEYFFSHFCFLDAIWSILCSTERRSSHKAGSKHRIINTKRHWKCFLFPNSGNH